MENKDTGNSADSGRTNIGINDLKEFLRAYEIRQLRAEFTGRVITLVIASLGLITALAWDDTLRGIVSAIFGKTSSLSGKVLYAIAITFIAVLISIGLGKIFTENQKK